MIAKPIFLSFVGHLFPLRFTAVAFTRETFKRAGEDWRTIPTALIEAIADTAIRRSSAQGRPDRIQMAHLIEYYVPLLRQPQDTLGVWDALTVAGIVERAMRANDAEIETWKREIEK